MNAHWERVHTPAGWHLRLKGANGEIVLTSETYTEKRTCNEALMVAVATLDTVNLGLEDVEES